MVVVAMLGVIGERMNLSQAMRLNGQILIAGLSFVMVYFAIAQKNPMLFLSVISVNGVFLYYQQVAKSRQSKA